ncbi:MAG: hypothetical protein ACI4D3_15085 [Lachnospiraceae bacterium]
MKRKKMKVFAAWILVCLIVVSGSIETKAYFDRGPVNVSVGKSSVSIRQGQSETVSVSFSPSKSSQLPGCGMAECPQSCGEKECLDENGECTCNGTTYQTYYAFATVSSSNTSVATAEYSSGSVRISGISAGTATVTVTASLRQFSSTSATIKVTVSKAAEETKETTKAETKAPTKAETKAPTKAETKETTKAETKAPTKAETQASTKAETKASSAASSKAESSASSQAGSSAAATSESVQGSVTAVQVTGETTTKAESGNESSADDKSAEETGKSSDSSEENEDDTLSAAGEESAETGDDSGITTIQSDRGPITFVPITAGKIGGEQLESILGEKAYVDFQKKDEAGTVLYAWEFCGTDLKKAEDIDLNVEMGTVPFEGCEAGNSSDSLYISFGHSGELPGTASLYIRVSDRFSDDRKLNLYSYEENQIKCLAENLAVENGYVTLTLDRCTDCILSAGTWEEGQMKSSAGSPWIWGIGAAALICVAAVVFLRSRKGSRK